MMPTFPRSPYHSVRRVFPSTAGRLAFQAVPSWIVGSLSLPPAYAVRRPVCIRPLCTSGSTRLSRTVSGHSLDCAPPWRDITPPPPGVLARVRVIVSRSVITYATPSVPLVGTSRFHRKAAYTRCLRCAGAPRRPTSGSGLSLLLRAPGRYLSAVQLGL